MNRYHTFLNENQMRKYPFDLNTEIHWIHGLVLDIKLIVQIVDGDPIDPLSIYIKKTYRTNNHIGLLFCDESTGKNVGTASGTLYTKITTEIQNDQLSESNNYTVLPIVQCSDSVWCAGQIVLSDVTDIIDLVPIGVTYFDISSTKIDPSLILSIRGSRVRHLSVNVPIDSIGLVDPELSKIYGSVRLSSDENLVIEGDKNTNTITMSLRSPESFEPECDTCNPQKCSGGAIYQMNNVLPDENGKIYLEGDGLISVGIPDPSEGTNVLLINTPLVTINDLCPNKDGSSGPSGPQGPSGSGGQLGQIICAEADCACYLCDEEAEIIANCPNIIEQEE